MSNEPTVEQMQDAWEREQRRKEVTSNRGKVTREATKRLIAKYPDEYRAFCKEARQELK